MLGGIYSAHVLLGLLGPILALAGVVAGVVAYSKSGTQSVWQKNAEAWKARAEERDLEVARLNGDAMDREQQMAELRERLSAVEALPDMSVVLAAGKQMADAGRQMAELHEQRAQERHESLVSLMGTIRDSLSDMVDVAQKSADAAQKSAQASQETAKKVNGD